MKNQESQKQYNNVIPKKWWQKIFQKKIDYTLLLDRTIITNTPDPQILNNKIQTSKYNYISFFPLNLIQQFTKLSNIYFLFIGILQTIPAISLSEGKPTIFLPLIIVVVISMIKDFIQDLKRHKSDKKQNQSEVQLLTPIGFAKRHWEVLQVGNIIKVSKDQYFPCDVILLDHNKQQKTSFIQTKNLDGETNLKLKKTCQQLNFIRSMSELDLQNVKIQFSFQKPNPFLSTFNGNVKIGDRKYMIQNSNVVLRGCSLKINEWAYGLCVYTGHQTKILLNSGSQKLKSSSLQRYLNHYFKYIFIFQIGVTLLSAILYGILYGTNANNQGYIIQNQSAILSALMTWGSWFISFSNFIPISLLVTVEIVRYGQGMKLNKDDLCSSKGQFTDVQTSNLNQQLGQIAYIMTDKTGTLTQNLMQFKCLYVNGQYFGLNQHMENQYLSGNKHQLSDRPVMMKQKLNLQESLMKQKVPNVDFALGEKLRIVNKISQNIQNGQNIRKSLLHLALCHNVITQKNAYSSSSPDELALVSFAKYIGYQFLQKNDDNELVIIQRLKNNSQKILKYRLLHVLQFSSERKRMSVILEDMNSQQHQILLLTKGADQIIIPRTRLQNKGEQKTIQLIKIQQALFAYACQGLRTLVLAQKTLDKREFQKWDQRYNEALTIIGPQRYQAIDKLQSEIQRDLYLIGATAIQDKLQDNVKQTIQQLKKSNIKVWMLTGDKRQTAVSIGFSCGLIDKQSERITLDCDAQHAKSLLANLTSMMHILRNKKVTIVSGDFIRKIDEQSRLILQNILLDSQSVICCRVSPKDKEFITQMVKKRGITLAIGDGANDVNMIHCASIGVGVRGIEGSQATRAADYVITQFKLLKRLVVYHGHNFYHRNANVMLYTLYKNMLITLPNLLYGPLSLQSATFIYQVWAVQFFNLFFVAFPIVYYGLFDILYSYKEVRQNPQLYKFGQTSSYFNKKILTRLLIQTIFISAFIIYTVFFSTELTPCSKGYMIYQQWSGNLVLAIVIVACNVRVILMSHQFNIMQGFLCFIGVVLYFLIYFLVGLIFYSDSKNTLSHQMSTGLYWLLIIFVTFVIEGILVVQNTIKSIHLLIRQKQNIKDKASGNIKQQIQMIGIEEPVRQLSVITDKITQKNQIGGYAFAEDENRMDFQAEYQSRYRARSLIL